MTRFRTIEIDIRLHRFIESHRRSFQESPCDILCRELKIEGEPPAPNGNGAAKPAGRPWTRKGVTLPQGTKAQMDYNGSTHTAEIVDAAWVTETGIRTISPSAAAGAVAKTKAGKRPSLDGWRYWRVQRPGDDKWVTLSELRRSVPPPKLEDL